jgi:acetoin utilization protein AcuB
MTTASLMTSRLFTVKPDDKVADALQLMHRERVHNLPVVDDRGDFLGLFGLRLLSRILLPLVASDLGRHRITSLHFLPDDTSLVSDRWQEVADQPVVNFLESKKKLRFCTPETRLPQLLSLLDSSGGATLPVIVVEKNSSRLVGMISSWDVLENIVMGCLVNGASDESGSADEH